MIRKDNVDVIELNRKMISKATIKPNLNAFPVRDVSVPFNSARNTPGLRQMALEKPVSFLEKNIGIAQQIESIRNNRNPITKLKKHNTRPKENMKIEVVDLEDDYRNNVLPILSPAEKINWINQLALENDWKYLSAVDTINDVAINFNLYKMIKSTSVDFYTGLKISYMNNQKKIIQE